MAYKVRLEFSDGSEYDCRDEFDTYEEAYQYGEYLNGCQKTGAEDLYMSNPGDYPMPDEFEDGEIIVYEEED